MTKPLDRLIGMALLAAQSDRDSADLQFTGCSFSAYARHCSSKPLAALIGLTVQSITYSSEDSLVISFSTGENFKVSLQPDDHEGPEAFYARFNDGPTVIGRQGA